MLLTPGLLTPKEDQHRSAEERQFRKLESSPLYLPFLMQIQQPTIQGRSHLSTSNIVLDTESFVNLNGGISTICGSILVMIHYLKQWQRYKIDANYIYNSLQRKPKLTVVPFIRTSGYLDVLDLSFSRSFVHMWLYKSCTDELLWYLPVCFLSPNRAGFLPLSFLLFQVSCCCHLHPSQSNVLFLPNLVRISSRACSW